MVQLQASCLCRGGAYGQNGGSDSLRGSLGDRKNMKDNPSVLHLLSITKLVLNIFFLMQCVKEGDTKVGQVS